MAKVVVLTYVGEAWIINKLDEAVQTTGDYIAWGTGSGTASKNDEALFDESPDEDRVIAVRTKPAFNKIRWVGTMTCQDNPKTITNAGNFTGSNGGTLIIHASFPGIYLDVNDGIEFTLELELVEP